MANILYTRDKCSFKDIKKIRRSEDADIISNYLLDESGIIKGWADTVYYPTNEEEVACILLFANRNGIRVTVSGWGLV